MSAEGFHVVQDDEPTIGGTRCIKPIGRSLCWLPKGHAGTCLPLQRARYLRDDADGAA